MYLTPLRNWRTTAEITSVSQAEVLEVGRQAMLVGLQVALPILLTALVVGLLVSIFQAVTQIQEMTLQFVPKIVAVGLVLLFAGSWMLMRLVEFTTHVLTTLPPR